VDAVICCALLLLLNNRSVSRRNVHDRLHLALLLERDSLNLLIVSIILCNHLRLLVFLIHQIREERRAEANCIFKYILTFARVILVFIEKDSKPWISVKPLRLEEGKVFAVIQLLICLVFSWTQLHAMFKDVDSILLGVVTSLCRCNFEPASFIVVA